MTGHRQVAGRSGTARDRLQPPPCSEEPLRMQSRDTCPELLNPKPRQQNAGSVFLESPTGCQGCSEASALEDENGLGW